MTLDKLDISVVLLCYQTEDEAPSYVEEVKACLIELDVQWEIVLVANYLAGSNDRTPGIAKNLSMQDPRVKVIAKEKKGMMGWDMKSGFEEASGKTIVVMDGDGQYPFTDIKRVYKKLIDEDLDIVKTYRMKRGDGWYRRTLSGVYNFVFYVFFPGFSCHDVNSKPKIFKADVLRKMELISDDWFIDAEIMIQVRRLKLNFSEISTQFTKLETRKSYVQPMAIIEFVVNMVLFRIRESIFLLKK